METIFEKRYKLAKSDNCEEFMKALGVDLVGRRMGNVVSPVVQLLKDTGGRYRLSSTSTLKSVIVEFIPSVKFDRLSPGGSIVKTVFTLDGNVLREVQTNLDTGKETVIVRTFTADEIHVMMTVGNITATQLYKLHQ